MRQHLAAVRAAAQISGGQIEGEGLGSSRLTFVPAEVTPGTYEFRVGTAGSATLVLQTVLPALLIADAPSDLTLHGGTHNPWAPPFDFLSEAYCPLVNRMGPEVTLRLHRPGFYPAGGGTLSAQIRPCPSLAGFDLLQRGRLLDRQVRAIVSALPEHIAQRECDQIARRAGWPQACFHAETVDKPKGPGNVLLIRLKSEHVTEVFTGFGRLGVRAEQVADETLDAAREYLDAHVPVGPHLADQLILLLAMSAHLGGGGGSYRTMPLTEHSRTHIQLLEQFLAIRIDVQQENSEGCTVSVRSS